MRLRILLITSVALALTVFHCSFNGTLIEKTPGWVAQLAMEVRELAQSVEKKDLDAFKNFFESDILVQSQINFYRDFLFKNYREIKIRIFDVQIFFTENDQEYCQVAIDDDFFLNQNHTSNVLKVKLIQGKIYSAQDSSKVRAEVVLRFSLIANGDVSSAFNYEEDGKQTLYFKQDEKGNWLITDFQVESTRKERRIF